MAAISIFDIFKVGIGPSSSHTVGPMKAAAAFVGELGTHAAGIATIEVTLFGSLAYTGRGHGTDKAVILGLSGVQPETVDPDSVETLLGRIRRSRSLDLPGIGPTAFDPDRQVVFNFEEELPRHTNGMRFRALAGDGSTLLEEI